MCYTISCRKEEMKFYEKKLYDYIKSEQLVLLSNKELALMFGVSENTIAVTLKELGEKKLITRITYFEYKKRIREIRCVK